MRKLFLTLAALLMAAVVAAPQAMAAGTLAGTNISNQAYADYKDANGNAMTRVLSNIVTVTVSQVAGVLIDPAAVSSSANSGATIDYLVQLFNTGNKADSQTFTWASTGDWAPTTVQMYYDVNNNHVYDAGTDVLLTETAPGSKTYQTKTAGGATMQVAADDDYDVIMRVAVPAAAANGTNDVITITTQSDYVAGGVKSATGTYTTTVLAAVLTAVKSHTPAGSPTYLKPGDTIVYTISLTNSGTAPATGVVITDPLPANLTYVAGSLKAAATVGALADKTDAADNDGIKYDSGTRSVIAPDGAATITVAAAGTWVIRFSATLNAGVASGSAVTNQATITYNAGSTITSNGDTFLVSNLAGIDLASTASPQTGNPGDRIVYPFTATNNGNASDTINLVPVSTAGWTWAVWVDADGNGIPGTGGDYLLTDTNSDGKIDTGALAQNGSINLLAVANIPVGAANGATDTVTFTGSSVADPAKTDTQAFTTTVKAPVLTVVKGLTAVNAPVTGVLCTPADTTNGSPCTVVPGSVLTYTVTITNSGNGSATSVVITDITPTYTTYKAGSIKTGSTVPTLTARTDATDGDGAEYNSGSHSVVVPDGGTLNIGASGTTVVQFQVTVN